jgi:hypothetical protein
MATFPHSSKPVPRRDPQRATSRDNRRSQQRVQGLLSRIEDTTYEVLRKHEKKSA